VDENVWWRFCIYSWEIWALVGWFSFILFTTEIYGSMEDNGGGGVTNRERMWEEGGSKDVGRFE
jgi:hypothetical protein